MKRDLTANPQEFVATIAMDAFRICIGATPRNHQTDDVIRWMRLMSEATTKA